MQPLAKLIVTGLGTYSVLEPWDKHIPRARFAQSNDYNLVLKSFRLKMHYWCIIL